MCTVGALALALAGIVWADAGLSDVIVARDAAMNAGDAKLAVTYYADDASYSVIFGPGEEPLTIYGKDAILQRLQPFAEGNVEYEASLLGVIGETARAHTKWTFDGLRADGFAYLTQFEEFVFEDGKIVAHTSTVLELVPLVAKAEELAESAQVFPINFTATLSGANVIPPIDTPARGSATATLVGDILTVTGNYADLQSEVFGQGSLLMPGVVVHQSKPGDDGPVVHLIAEAVYPGQHNLSLLTSGGTSGTFTGVYRLTDEQIHDLKAGLFYLAIHTEAEPRGELRGQFVSSTKVELTVEDLIGEWRREAVVDKTHYRFSLDGTVTAAATHDLLDENPIETGRFEIEGTKVIFTTADDNLMCAGVRGEYEALLTGDHTLRLFPLDDPCPTRVGNLNGALLKPVDR
jgi:hypothetical protein